MSRDSCQLCPGIRHCQPDQRTSSSEAVSGKSGPAFFIPREGVDSNADSNGCCRYQRLLSLGGQAEAFGALPLNKSKPPAVASTA